MAVARAASKSRLRFPHVSFTVKTCRARCFVASHRKHPMLILASSSPRRRELLARAGIAFEVQAVNTPEVQRAGESPLEYCRRLAHEKAASIWNARTDALVLGADTIVIVDNQVLGKPRAPADARRMLSLISGRAHDVTTAVCLLYSESGAHRQLQEEVTTRVFVDPLTESDIEEYVRSGEPLDK